MPPLVIADSDDEDNHYSPSPSPRSPQSPDTRAEATRSSDRVSHATSSTDPSYFQNIYNEQSNAARSHQSKNHLNDGAEGMTSSEVTAPATFHRTVTAFEDPSSLTSLTDPTAPKKRTVHGVEVNEWTQISTPGRKKAAAAKMEQDIYDIPSSPEDGRAVTVQSARKPGPTSGRVERKPLSPLRNPRRSPKVSKKAQIDEATSEDGSPDVGRKRRRLETTQQSLQGSNEVDLVTIPFSNDSKSPRLCGVPTQSSMLPPTLPLSSDNSFYVTGGHLTESQKLQYQDMQPMSSDGIKDNSLPILNHAQDQYQGSSGTATNVNTPRSDYPPLHTPSTVPRTMESASGKSRLYRPSYPDRDSSPDIIAAVESTISSEKKTRIHEPRDSNLEVYGEASEVEDASYGAKSRKGNLRADDDEVGLHQEPIKPKKARGRPKKNTQSNGLELPSPAKSQTEAVGTTAKLKKKRGRPRKSEQPLVTEESTKAQATPTDKVVDIAISEAMQVDVEFEKSQHASKDKDSMVDKKQGESPAIEDQAHSEKLEDHEPTSALQRKTSPQSAGPESIIEEDVPAAKDVKPSAAAGREETATTGKGPKQHRGLASSAPGSASKPLFRVGLSKKTRIAPLLKSLRK